MLFLGQLRLLAVDFLDFIWLSAPLCPDLAGLFTESAAGMSPFEVLQYRHTNTISITLLFAFLYNMKALGGRGGTSDFLLPSSTFSGEE
jgi:hypothetical protein